MPSIRPVCRTPDILHHPAMTADASLLARIEDLEAENLRLRSLSEQSRAGSESAERHALPMARNLLVDGPADCHWLQHGEEEVFETEHCVKEPPALHRRRGVDFYLAGVMATAVLWIATYLALPRFLDTEDAQTWPVVAVWMEFAVGLICFVRYLNRHVVKERVPILLKSMLLWQVIFLSATYAGVAIAFPQIGFEHQTVPSNLLVLLFLAGPATLDACNTTKKESQFSFAFMIFGVMAGIIGNTLFFENAIVYEGYSVKVDPQGRQVWTGQFTKNGIRLNILYTQLLLLMGSLFTAFVYDKGHTQM